MHKFPLFRLLACVALFIVAEFAAFYCSACASAPAKAVSASTCRERGNTLIDTADTCKQATAAIAKLIASNPECAAIFEGAGAGLRCRDGGAQ